MNLKEVGQNIVQNVAFGIRYLYKIFCSLWDLEQVILSASHLQYGNYNDIYLTGELWKLNEILCVSYWAQYIIYTNTTCSYLLTAAAAKLLQSCPTLCNPIDGSPPGSLVPGILQARTLEWVAISFSNAWKWKVKVKSLSHVWLLATPWTAAFQAPLSMGFSRQEYWSGCHRLLLLHPINWLH